MQALRSQVFVEVQRDLAIRARAQPMSPRLEITLNRLVFVEFSVGDDMRSVVFAPDRLISGGEIDDARPRVGEPDTVVSADPLSLSVGPAVIESFRCAFQRCRRNRPAARID